MASIQQLLATYASSAAASFPALLDVTGTDSSTNSANHAIAMPSSASVGDLLVMIVTTNVATTTTTPSGWTLLYTETSITPRTSIYYKGADGTEGGTTVDVVTASSCLMSGIVSRVAAATYSGAPELTTPANGSSVAPDSPSLSPSWGALNTLWIAVASTTNNRTVTSYPYATSQTQTTNGPLVAVCYTGVNAAFLDPPAFALSVSTTWAAFTVAIRPV